MTEEPQDRSQPRIVFAEPRFRFVAMVVDLLLLEGLCELASAAIFGAAYWVRVKTGAIPASTELDKAVSPEIALLGDLLISLGVFLVYQTAMMARWGGTVGKLLFKIRVVDAKNLRPVTWKRAFVRAVAWIPAYLPFCMGLAMAIMHPERRGMPDLIAGTATLRTRRLGKK